MYILTDIMRAKSSKTQIHYVCTPMLKLLVKMVYLQNGITNNAKFLINIFKEQLIDKDDEYKKAAVREFLMKALDAGIEDHFLIPSCILVIKEYINMYKLQ